MTDDSLTYRQRELLQRWFDDEVDGPEAGRAEELLESSAAARGYVERLREVRSAAEIAFGEAHQSRGVELSAEEITRRAEAASPLVELPLEELAPLLERYHDAEVTPEEQAAVEGLLVERDDVVDYLENLDFLARAIQTADTQASRGVTTDGIWDGVQRSLSFEHDESPPDYRPERDQALVHRYVDGELDEERRAQVEQWLDDPESEASRSVETIRRLGDAARAGFDRAGERADLDAIWEGVDQRLEAEADEGAEVVSFDEARRERTERDETSSEEGASKDTASTGGQSAEGGGMVEWLGQYGQALVGAAAATLIVVGAAALFDLQLFQQERVVKEKTVVIVDSVQYESGSSVVVDSPMKQVGGAAAGENAEKKGDKPTVIWLLNSNGESQSDEEKPGREAPSSDEGGSRDAGGQEDAGDDAGTPPPGQPI